MGKKLTISKKILHWPAKTVHSSTDGAIVPSNGLDTVATDGMATGSDQVKPSLIVGRTTNGTEQQVVWGLFPHFQKVNL